MKSRQKENEKFNLFIRVYYFYDIKKLSDLLRARC